MLTTQKTTTTYHFANRLDIEEWFVKWLKDTNNKEIWFVDQTWMKDKPDRYEVVIIREEPGTVQCNQ